METKLNKQKTVELPERLGVPGNRKRSMLEVMSIPVTLIWSLHPESKYSDDILRLRP